MKSVKAQIIGERVTRLRCVHCNTAIDLRPYDAFEEIQCPHCDTKQTVPMRFGKFLLTRILGQGGMGAVYEALDQSLGRFVAVKTLNAALRADKRFVENFLREARAAAALNHYNIVHIYESGEHLGIPYIVMELVSGGRLDKQMADTPRLDECHVLQVGIQVAEGLKAAQDIGLLHGDIKPANIMFDRNGAAKVVDFGLARFAGGREVAPGEVWGTPYYIAPEKAQKKKEDLRADLYSLGGTLYHALTGQPPFDGATAKDVVLARLHQPPPKLRNKRSDCHPETEEILSRMLNPSPMLRYPNYASLIPDMQRALSVAKRGSFTGNKQFSRELGKFVGALSLITLLIIGGVVTLITVIRSDALQQEEARKRQIEAQALGKIMRAQASPSQSMPTVETRTPIAKNTPDELRAQPTSFPAPIFTPKTLNELENALQLAVRGDGAALMRAVESVGRDLPEDTPESIWLALFGAFGAHAAGDIRSAELFAAGLQNCTDPLPRALNTLATTGEQADFLRASDRRPAWSLILAQLATGIYQFRSGHFEAARQVWQTYVTDASTADPTWPYVFQAAARDLVSALNEFEILKTQVNQELENDRPLVARDLLTTYVRGAHGVLRTSILPLEQLIWEKEAALTIQAQRQAQEAHEALIQAELDRIDMLRKENQELITSRDFRRAAATLNDLLHDIKTDEGRAAIQLLRQSYERQDALLIWLIESIRHRPFSEVSDLGGPVVAAARDGVRVQLGPHGTVLRTWVQVSMRSLVQMTRFYAAGLPPDAQGERFLNLALLCAYGNAMRPASESLKHALEKKPALAIEAQKLLPDLTAQ